MELAPYSPNNFVVRVRPVVAGGEDTRGEKAVGTVKEVAVKARDEIRTMNFILF